MLKEMARWILQKELEETKSIKEKLKDVEYQLSVRKTKSEDELTTCKETCLKAASENSRLKSQVESLTNQLKKSNNE